MAQEHILLMAVAIILFPALILLYLTRRMKKKINEEIMRLDREIRKMKKEQKI
jgi:cell division protein FtsL